MNMNNSTTLIIGIICPIMWFCMMHESVASKIRQSRYEFIAWVFHLILVVASVSAWSIILN